MKRFILASLVAYGSTHALADGDFSCNAPDANQWKELSALNKKLWMEDLEAIKTQVKGDCFEAYGRNAQGQLLEIFYHPVTLEKLLVLRRGKEVFRKEGR